MGNDSWTFKTADLKVRRDLDLLNSDTVTQAEMMDYFNDGLRDMEAEIHTLGVEDDYFLSRSDLQMVLGDEIVNFPDDIYGTKIRGLIYTEGLNLTYPVERYKRYDKFLNQEIDKLRPGTNTQYMYDIINEDADIGPQITLTPEAQASSTTFLKLRYIRQAKKITQIGDKIDIPQYINYLFAHVKYNILKNKEKFVSEEDQANLIYHRGQFVKALTGQTADNNDLIQMDTSIYEEHA